MLHDLVRKTHRSTGLIDRKWVKSNKHLRELRLSFGVWRYLIGGAAAGEQRADHIQLQRQTRTLPVTDGQRAFRCFDGRRVSREPSRSVKAAFHRQLLATHSIGRENAVG